MEEATNTYALRCFLNGKRKKTDKLTKFEARIYRAAARHLARYLGKEYHLGK
jgi:hypothetical protein